MPNLLWVIALALAIMWGLGFALHLGGGFIHVLLVLAVISVLTRIFMSRRLA